MRCRPSLVRGRAAQVNPGGFTTPARRPSVPHRTAGCGKSSLRPLMAGSSPSLPDGSNPSAAIVQSASDVQCSRLLKTTMGGGSRGCGNTRLPCVVAAGGLRDTVQGFLFARPMPAAAFVGFVNQWRNTTMNANDRAPVAACAARKSPARCRLHAGRGRVRGVSAGWVLSALLQIVGGDKLIIPFR